MSWCSPRLTLRARSRTMAKAPITVGVATCSSPEAWFGAARCLASFPTATPSATTAVRSTLTGVDASSRRCRGRGCGRGSPSGSASCRSGSTRFCQMRSSSRPMGVGPRRTFRCIIPTSPSSTKTSFSSRRPRRRPQRPRRRRVRRPALGLRPASLFWKAATATERPTRRHCYSQPTARGRSPLTPPTAARPAPNTVSATTSRAAAASRRTSRVYRSAPATSPSARSA
mmetsp:Transcript_22472/g.70517  ORF Transcript_22472/g.70517 Transcript_22472/m.70517 type:complete len:228 (-) Transcript_22472:968-1651(-)